MDNNPTAHHLKVNGGLLPLSNKATVPLHHNRDTDTMRPHRKTIPISLLHHNSKAMALLHSNSGVHLPLSNSNSVLLLQTNMALLHQLRTSLQP